MNRPLEQHVFLACAGLNISRSVGAWSKSQSQGLRKAPVEASVEAHDVPVRYPIQTIWLQRHFTMATKAVAAMRILRVVAE